MSGPVRVLKFQALSFIKSLIIGILVGLGIFLISNIFLVTILHGSESKVIEFGSELFFGIAIIISLFFLIIQCFMCFFEDLKISTRLGITRENFFYGNLIFFISVILLYSLVFSSFSGYFPKTKNLDNASEEIISSLELENTSEEANRELNERVHEKIIIAKDTDFFTVFLKTITMFLGLVGFWQIFAFLIFNFQVKALIVLIPFFAIWGNITSFDFLSGWFGKVLIFILAQLLIYFGLKKFDSI